MPMNSPETAAPTTQATLALTADLAGRAWAWNVEPVETTVDTSSVTWRCPGGTDFWRVTEGVPSAHDGCSLLTPLEGDFEFELSVTGAFEDNPYDQVGLMVVASEVRWLKAGVEFDGGFWLSAVHTREQSDWSRERWRDGSATVRAARVDGTIELHVSEDGSWRPFRTVYLPGRVGVGPYSCSPKGTGFQATATDLSVRG
jgi:uncharacterized protein